MIELNPAQRSFLARDPRIGRTVVDPDDPFRWLSVSGAATLVDEGAEDQIDNLARKYLDEFPYPGRAPGERRVTARIAIDRIESRGV